MNLIELATDPGGGNKLWVLLALMLAITLFAGCGSLPTRPPENPSASLAENTDAELVIFRNCGHFFDDHLNDLRTAVCEWTSASLDGAN